jgi:chitinase
MVSYPYTKIDWSAITHLAVAFANINNNSTLAYQGGNLDSTLAKKVTAAAHANGRKAILMLGGVGSAANFASSVKGDLNKFVTNIVTLAKGDGFDGVDIDWEGLYPQDFDSFRKLAVALKTAWPQLFLTCAIGWDQTDNAFFGTLKDSSGAWLFDQFNVMTYDAANNWGGWISWFHNALADEGPDHPSSAQKALAGLANAGVPKARIGMGIPFYGSAWAGGSPLVTGPRQKITSGASATQGMDSTWTYKFIMDNYAQPYDATTKVGVVFDTAAGATYFTGGSSGYSRNGVPKVSFISYDDPTSIAKKGAWLKANGYGGTIIWLINEGVVDTLGTNPLLNAVKESFLP